MATFLVYLYLIISGNIKTSPSEKPASSRASHTVILVCKEWNQTKLERNKQRENRITSISSKPNLKSEVVFTSFHRGGDEFREGVVVGSLDTWRPGKVVFVVEEYVAVVGVDGSGEILGVHLRATETIVGGRVIGGHWNEERESVESL